MILFLFCHNLKHRQSRSCGITVLHILSPSSLCITLHITDVRVSHRLAHDPESVPTHHCGTQVLPYHQTTARQPPLTPFVTQTTTDTNRKSVRLCLISRPSREEVRLVDSKWSVRAKMESGVRLNYQFQPLIHSCYQSGVISFVFLRGLAFHCKFLYNSHCWLTGVWRLTLFGKMWVWWTKTRKKNPDVCTSTESPHPRGKMDLWKETLNSSTETWTGLDRRTAWTFRFVASPPPSPFARTSGRGLFVSSNSIPQDSLQVHFPPLTSAAHRTNGRKWCLACAQGSRMDGTCAASLAVVKSASGPH